MVPHYGLYAQGRDKVILVSNLTGILVATTVTLILASELVELSVMIGVIAGFSAVALAKFYFYSADVDRHKSKMTNQITGACKLSRCR